MFGTLRPERRPQVTLLDCRPTGYRFQSYALGVPRALILKKQDLPKEALFQISPVPTFKSEMLNELFC